MSVSSPAEPRITSFGLGDVVAELIRRQLALSAIGKRNAERLPASADALDQAAAEELPAYPL